VENFAVFDELQNSMKGLAALGWGGHWQDADYDGYRVSKTYGQIIDGIKEDPRYEQTFDESIPYQERESIRIELDKQIRQSLEQGWIKFLAEVEREMLIMPLKINTPLPNLLFSPLTLLPVWLQGRHSSVFGTRSMSEIA
jgi:hypothetical protein